MINTRSRSNAGLFFAKKFFEPIGSHYRGERMHSPVMLYCFLRVGVCGRSLARSQIS